MPEETKTNTNTQEPAPYVPKNSSDTDTSAVDPIKWIPGLGTLGRGYDVFGRYAHPASVINARLFLDFAILDNANVTETYNASINGNAYVVPSVVSLIEEHTSENAYIEGSTVSEFQSELDVNTKISGRYKYYSGEAKFAFNQEKRSSNEYYYTRFTTLARSYRLALPGNDHLLNRLDPSFKRLLNEDDHSEEAIDALFAAYGTHFLAEIVLGGRNSYFATVEKSAVSSKMAIKASVKASYNNLFSSAKVAVDSSYYSEESVSSTHSETGIETIGGDATKAPLMVTDPDTYGDWLETINQDPALVDFTEHSLRPIWDLVDEENTERKQALENRFLALSGTTSYTETTGTLNHGAAVYPPWGNKNDWNIFFTPAVIGRTENDPTLDADNAILDFDYGNDASVNYPDHWQVKARYRFRTEKESSAIKWYDGRVNFMLVPKYADVEVLLDQLDYDTYDPETATFYLEGEAAYYMTTQSLPNAIVAEDENGNLSEPIYEDISYKDGLFYQRKLLSKIENATYEDMLVSPNETDSWNRLVTLNSFNYADDDKYHDNALLWWHWHTPQANASLGALTEGFYVRYRKGEEEDYVKGLGPDYQVLWVLADYSHWTGGSGIQRIKPPSQDPDAGNWELMVSPLRMGDDTETEKSDLKDSSLLMTQCLMVRQEADWEITGNYLYMSSAGKPETVATQNGQVECLLVHKSVLVQK